MQIKYTKNLNSGIFELGTTFGLLPIFTAKFGLEIGTFLTLMGDKPDTRFLLE